MKSSWLKATVGIGAAQEFQPKRGVQKDNSRYHPQTRLQQSGEPPAFYTQQAPQHSGENAIYCAHCQHVPTSLSVTETNPRPTHHGSQLPIKHHTNPTLHQGYNPSREWGYSPTPSYITNQSFVEPNVPAPYREYQPWTCDVSNHWDGSFEGSHVWSLAPHTSNDWQTSQLYDTKQDSFAYNVPNHYSSQCNAADDVPPANAPPPMISGCQTLLESQTFPDWEWNWKTKNAPLQPNG
jgi:hypothetical protein